MANVKNIVVLSVVLSMYLLSVIGVGRYSCHCDHAAQITLFGIVTSCGCTDEDHTCHADHKCICGAKLEARKTKKDDCCAVSYIFLKADQVVQDLSFDIIINASDVLMPQFARDLYSLEAEKPYIKNFHALFRHWRQHLYQKNNQLKL